MSRSTNTTPARVRLARDPAVRRERHDHRLHECDLPSLHDLAQERRYWRSACCYSAARWNRALSWRCDCDWCRCHTPPRTLRSQGRNMLSQLVARPPDESLLDEIDDVATPRR